MGRRNDELRGNNSLVRPKRSAEITEAQKHALVFAEEQNHSLAGGACGIGTVYLPNGESIQRRESDDGEFISGGIQPDFEVEKDRLAVNGDLKSDNQLRKALSIVRSKL